MSKKSNYYNWLILIIKGIFMGGADIIPGVSGGTIALLVGVYSDLINSLKAFNFRHIKNFFQFIFFKKNFKEFSQGNKELNLKFLIPLFIGICIAFALGSKIIPMALKSYPAPTYSLFFGLILASVKIPFKKIQNKSFSIFIFMLIGIIFAFFITGMKELGGSTPSSLFVFCSGFIAISAMLLPGISGSFILLLLGVYNYILENLHHFISNLLHFNFWDNSNLIILLFASGLILGLITFSRFLSFLLAKYNDFTMAFLTGLLFGSLRKPYHHIITNTSGSISILYLIVFFFLGIILVLGLEYLEKKFQGK